MSDLTPEKLAELRLMLSEAPPLPYRDSPATHGDPSNGPTYVALEAQWEGRWEEVATGNYDQWSGMGLALATAAANALPDLLDAVDERDALAAKLDEVREWIDRRGVNVDDRDDDYMRGYRDAQRHALHDANDLRAMLDA